MENFWDSNVWGFFCLIAVLMTSLLVANMLKRSFPILEASLIPTSVLGGGILLVFASIYKIITDVNFFDTALFDGNGSGMLEMITYHCLALGFIASALKTSDGKFTKQRTVEILNTGFTTVATYLLQAFVGMIVCIIASFFLDDFLAAAGILLALGYGQGTGQAMNYGSIYEGYGLVGGKSFGLTIAALGFLCAAFGGVIHLNILKRQGKIKLDKGTGAVTEEVEGENEVPMQENMDKFTIQMGLIVLSYAIGYILMYLLGNLVPGLKSAIYGFNFLLGVIAATLLKAVLKALQKKSIIHRNYTNNFLLTRSSNFFFDIMVTAGVAAIRLDQVEAYWGVIVLLGLLGLVVTYVYLHFVCNKLFPSYADQQFLAMYGMLTGTASTGVILLREIDGDFKTPVADNLVYQNFPAMVLGFPILILATMAPTKPYFTLAIIAAFGIVINILLFRSLIFKKKAAAVK